MAGSKQSLPARLGFVPVKGSGGNRYYAPESYTGPRAADGTVTRRQVRNLGAKEHGFSSLAQYETLRNRYANDDRFQNFMRMWFEKEYPSRAFDRNGDRLGVRTSVYPGMQSGIVQAYARIPEHVWHDRKSREYRSPDGPVAQFLVALGYREENWRHAVDNSDTATAGG